MNDEVLLKALKLSLRIDEDFDDEILKLNLKTAIVYLKQAIGEEDAMMKDFYDLETVQPLFQTAVIALASTYYMYRVSVQIAAVNSVDPISRSLIGQLRTMYLMERRSREKSKP